MRITGVDIYGLELRYVHGTYTMSGGRSADAQQSTLVQIRTDEGIEGWGEACPLGATYLEDFAEGVRAAMPLLAQAVIGLDPRELAAVGTAMELTLRGQRAAKSAIDVACWDILGKSTGLPVCTLLGGRRSEDFPLYRRAAARYAAGDGGVRARVRAGRHARGPAEASAAIRSRMWRGRRPCVTRSARIC